MEATTVLIDTSLFIEHIRSRDKANTLLARIHARRHRLATSAVVVGELCYGARTPEMRAEIDRVLFPVKVIPFTKRMALRVSIEVEHLKAKNQIIGFRDLAIACVALVRGLPVATHNRREFGCVDGLRLFELDEDGSSGGSGTE